MDSLVCKKYVAELLKHQGYQRITLTERYDYGVDIVAQKDGTTWGIQVKRYTIAIWSKPRLSARS